MLIKAPPSLSGFAGLQCRCTVLFLVGGFRDNNIFDIGIWRAIDVNRSKWCSFYQVENAVLRESAFKVRREINQVMHFYLLYYLAILLITKSIRFYYNKSFLKWNLHPDQSRIFLLPRTFHWHLSIGINVVVCQVGLPMIKSSVNSIEKSACYYVISLFS